MGHYIDAWRQGFVFSGRSTRQAFWWFMLIHVLIGFGLIIFDVFTGTFVMEVGLGAFSALYSVASVFPSFAVGARRLHDINFRGWWQVLLVVPLLGVTILCVLFALRSNPGENRFGDHPLAQAG